MVRPEQTRPGESACSIQTTLVSHPLWYSRYKNIYKCIYYKSINFFVDQNVGWKDTALNNSPNGHHSKWCISRIRKVENLVYWVVDPTPSKQNVSQLFMCRWLAKFEVGRTNTKLVVIKIRISLWVTLTSADTLKVLFLLCLWFVDNNEIILQ